METKFVFCGTKTRLNYYTELAYLSVSAEKARATCLELNPDFVIESWYIED
jgi:hypothetical protein